MTLPNRAWKTEVIRKQVAAPRRLFASTLLGSRLRIGEKRTKYLIHGIDDCLGRIQLNQMPGARDHAVLAARRQTRQSFMPNYGVGAVHPITVTHVTQAIGDDALRQLHAQPPSDQACGAGEC